MVEVHTPKSTASASSIVRNDSPYCEASGPIVHEGFVAARVRAVQAKCDGTQQKISHSPMKICPTPRWLQITDHVVPPQCPLPSGRAAASQRRDISTEPAILQFHSYRPQSSFINTTMPIDAVDIAASSPSLEKVNEAEKSIPRHQTIRANNAKTYKGWSSSLHGVGYHHDIVGLEPKLSSNCRIADKIGSLTDRGWVGYNIFGKAYNDRHAFPVLCSHS